jgi:hypothetical protein
MKILDHIGNTTLAELTNDTEKEIIVTGNVSLVIQKNMIKVYGLARDLV